jgi:hypothetical protein
LQHCLQFFDKNIACNLIVIMLINQWSGIPKKKVATSINGHCPFLLRNMGSQPTGPPGEACAVQHMDGNLDVSPPWTTMTYMDGN